VADDSRIKKIVILGGGTAGWLSAFLLRKSLGDSVEIDVIESPNRPIIGVGEATVPTFKFTMRHLGFKESQWMPTCEASYKLAVRFNNWLSDGHKYYHPFHFNKEFNGIGNSFYKLSDLPQNFDLLQIYASIKASDRKTDFANFSSSLPALCDKNLSPRKLNTSTRTTNYAYHFDTALLNNFFREQAPARNIKYSSGTFKNAELDEKGFIKSLCLEDEKKISGDLFIDCTGFNSLLLGQVLKEKFIYQHDYLKCDSALAIQLPYVDRSNELEPYTSATALKAGWVWKIPLQHRIGTGYVYSSQHTSDDEAWKELAQHYKGRTEDLNPRKISMRVGRYERTWVKNCIAIGLAGSFIEPLESTSIGISEYQIHSLIQLFPDKNFDEHLQNRFNQKINFCYDQLRDYIILHYYLSKRRDSSFWKDVTENAQLPDSLKDFLSHLNEWISYPKADADWAFFQRFNFGCILSGMQSLPEVSLPVLKYLDTNSIENFLADLNRKTSELCAELPSLETYLQNLANSEDI
jgi:hypothetical protein